MADNSQNRKVVGFKKFSEIKGKSKIEEVNQSIDIDPDKDSDIPMNPNLPKNSNKIEKLVSRKNIIPKEQDVNLPSDKEEFKEESSETNEKKVETYGKVAKFPKNVKASKAYNFLENIKVSKKSIWYIMIEKMDNELQMVKYNYKEGVDLFKFINELKAYYLKKYSNDPKVCKMIESITVDGNDKYSMIKNIPPITLDGKKMITKITEDLIKLLSKW